MPGKHKDTTIVFRSSAWARALIEQRARLSGIYKKDFITKSCVYSNIVMVGKKENIQRIVDSLQEMQSVMREIARQIQAGDFSLSEGSYQELKEDYLSLVITVVDIVELRICLTKSYHLIVETGKQNWNWSSTKIFWDLKGNLSKEIDCRKCLLSI